MNETGNPSHIRFLNGCDKKKLDTNDNDTNRTCPNLTLIRGFGDLLISLEP